MKLSNISFSLSFSLSQESISHRAKELWQDLGAPDGQDLAIWLQAEQESISHRAKELWQHLGAPDGQDLAIWLQAEREFSDLSKVPVHAIDRDRLQECLDSFGSTGRSRGPTSLDLT